MPEAGAAAGASEAEKKEGRRPLDHLVVAAALAGLLGGLAALGLGEPAAARWIWAGGTLLCLAWLSAGVLRDLMRGRAGVDLIALLAMGGALLVGEQLAGAVVALMLAGGQELERYAGGRARRELAALVSRAPRIAHRIGPDGVADLPLEQVVAGDRLLVRSGEVLPVDGRVAAGAALLDESALTGEPLPVERPAGDLARSGTLNAGAPFELLATATAEASTYAGILRLVASAERDKAPMVRLADRYAVFFLPFTLLMAAAAWIAAGDPRRALAVLVVATPCPLILAAPVAIVAGLSRAARAGVIVKGGGALEALARSTIVLLDKTGTLTRGEPRLAKVEALDGFAEDEVLRLAASLESASTHVLAPAVVAGARARGLALTLPELVREEPGDGIEGKVEGRMVRVGLRSWVAPEAEELGPEGGGASSSPWVAIGGRLAGMLLLEDEIRPEAAATLAALRRGGIREIVLVTGDRRAAGEAVGAAAGVDRVIADASPAEKVAAIVEAGGRGVTVMVGDGINDAPALAAASVGVAMGARGASAASETADAVIVADRLDLLAEAILIARRSRLIATQSIVAGMALSGIGMVLAAFGLLPPLAGAIAQEAIDLAVILNALRALGSGRHPAAGGLHD